MEKIVKIIGSFILALICVSPPFICALSYALNWNNGIKFILTMITIGTIICGAVTIYTESEAKEKCGK